MTLPKPQWLKIRSQVLDNNILVEKMLKCKSLHTVCEEANCPNINECFSKRTVTFMILGRQCTRNCTFCTVNKNEPEEVMENEPQSVAEAVRELDLKHVVITSVTRDDLADGGAGHFARVIKAIRDADEKVAIEVLIPDFKGDNSALKRVVNARPEVIGHNIETVPRLYPDVRPMASFERSVGLLKNVKEMSEGIYTKSGIMVGLGEREFEVTDALKELRRAGCDLLTIGQYLSPSKKHHPVVEYIHPDTFEKYKKIALEMGFIHVAAAPFVRSSYHASDGFGAAKEKSR